MSNVVINGSSLGSTLTDLLMKEDLVPGDEASYQLAKAIYLYHPLGAKMAEAPIAAVQSQRRVLTLPGAPEGPILKAFADMWDELECDRHIFSSAVTARIYGVSSIIVGVIGEGSDATKSPLPLDKLAELDIFFNVLDPLNASGSFSNMTSPNESGFQRFTAVTSQGVVYHSSRAVVLMNEQPVYLSYEASAYGWTGRSVYQRALYPLKSFVQTMITDDMVTRKAGILIAKIKQVVSTMSNAINTVLGVKRNLLKEARTGNVISIGESDDITAIDMTNVAGAAQMARKNVLENCAMAADMPAKWLNNESFAEGFGEGAEDAKAVARYVDRYRNSLDKPYAFITNIVMRKAWTPEFYKTIQASYPDAYKGMDYQTALYSWINNFSATWPSLLTEPDSEKIKVEDVKFKAIISLIEALGPQLDPGNMAALIEWALDNINENELLFPHSIHLDIDSLQEFLEETKAKADEAAANLATGGGDEAGDKPEQEPKPKVESE